ncbi:MAG: hypothetical protein FJX42_03605 [Alphaproteobacteria bacterium]|nr:hypothetical protein [Alphaproteobacteria bacterium]
MSTHRHQRSLEVVGHFAGHRSFEAAIKALLAAGFVRSDLSVLSTHESLDAVEREPKPWRDALVAVAGEIKYEAPLIVSGAVILAGGPIAATVAGLVAAAVGGMAVKEVVDEVTATPHRESCLRALAAGSIILWVRVQDAAQEQKAIRSMKDHGGLNVHVHEVVAPS